MAFARAKNSHIRNKAIELMILNFSQREQFREEILKIELIISEKDQELYNTYKENVSRVKKLTAHLILDDLEYLLLSNFDKEKYKNRVRDTTIIIKNMRSSLKRIFPEKIREQRLEEIKKSQNILRQFGIHELLIHSMKQIFYRPNEHFQLFSAILGFLEYFCWNNTENQNLLMTYVNYLLSLNQWDLDSPALISEIMKSRMNSTIGSQFYKFIVEKITLRSLYNAHLFNFLASTITPKSKMYILNKIIKVHKFRELMMDSDQAHKKIELLEVFYKKRRTLKDNIILQEKEFLDAHMSLVNLYAK